MDNTPRPVTILDTGKIAVYRGAIRCRILRIATNIITTKPRWATVNFGANVPPQRVSVKDLRVLPGEMTLNPSDAVLLPIPVS